MAAPPSSRLQTMLQAAVQSVKWSYSLFWQICPQQGILVWGDGYYNGPIKTRKTVNSMEVTAEEASLQRSQQLRELYESLSAGETNQPARRPCASLSPEDLTETEWFYLMCVSFSFPPGVGLPGRAYARRQHVWLTGAAEVDSKTFSRAILAKSARIQTVVCIPLLDGVVELGTTERLPEDIGLIAHVKTFFVDHNPPHPPKPALSEHSTSNPATSSDHPHLTAHPPRFNSPTVPSTFYVPPRPLFITQGEGEDGEDEDEDEDEEESDSEDDTTDRAASQSHSQNPVVGPAVEPSELMQLEMSEDIRLGSPDDGSNNLDSDFPMLTVTQPSGVNDMTDHQRRVDSFRAESNRRWKMAQDSSLRANLQTPPPSVPPQLDELSQEDTHYSQTVSTILHTQPTRWVEPSSTYVSYSSQSAFSAWTARSDHLSHVPSDGTSQWLLKYILFSVPFLHNKYRDQASPKSREDEGPTRIRKTTTQDELSANHVLAERRRREKLNERFIILRSLVPFVTKMDKASILGDTIEYLKQLRKKIQDLEARNRQIEVDQRSRLSDPQKTSSSKEQRSGVTANERARSAPLSGSDKRKMRIVEGSVSGKPKAVESPPPPPPPPQPPSLPPPPTVPAELETSIQVSIIESDALLEIQCPHREGLLLDVMQMLREVRIETTSVQSSMSNGFFIAELRAKVKEHVNGRKPSIVEVKRAMQQLIPHDS
uniref:Basic helix-loop-helix transcription factor n=1 Tax=Clarkia gracilis subsp. sonomensis TaxID=1906248 RepID=A0A7U3NUX7_9MYRT|nr:basic helix-loop-helix transcription factor [Clarkia gracilis subsp. sonomensis]QPB72532.1 basic helix-loop-helix transcription factor [Clarkia gracilis subsp. sonomensis]